MTYYAILGGGLGDAVMHYINTPMFRKLEAIKANTPNFDLHIYSQVHNNGVEDLFWYHPVVTRHLHIAQLPQFQGYGKFDHSLIPKDLRPLSSVDLFNLPDSPPIFNLSHNEQKKIDQLFESKEPVIVIQPFAGLSERDAFDQNSLHELVECLPGKKIIIGNNAPRGCVDRIQKFISTNPNVINLIDSVGIRFTYHLVARCNAFIGCHSSIVLLSWYHDKPTVCILPMPFLEDHWNRLNPNYKKGVDRNNTLITSFETIGRNCPNDFQYNTLDYNKIKEFLTPFC